MKKKILFIFLLVFSSHSIFSQSSIRQFIFGHSLIHHDPPLIPTPSNETTVPHWIFLLAQEAGHAYGANGQYGFLPQHATPPTISQWGYDLVPSFWDSDTEPFTDADFNHIMLTAGNFMQWQGPAEPYPNEGGLTVISATETIVDWCNAQEDSLKIYIYENWPDMSGYITNDFPPSSSDFANYNAYVLGDFHDWWIEYQDSLLLSRPASNLRMIPVGPIIAELLGSTPYSSIPLGELYEDDAPHGRASLYFLAGLISYMAIYEEEAPASYTVPSIVHETIRNNYSSIVTQVWTYLQNFNTPSGDSRVFFPSGPPIADADNDGIEDSLDNCPNVSNNDQADFNNDGIGDACQAPDAKVMVEEGMLFHDFAEGILIRGRDGNCYLIYIDEQGTFQNQRRPCPE